MSTTATPGMPSTLPFLGPLPTISLCLISFLTLHSLISSLNTASSKKPSWISLFNQAASPPAWAHLPASSVSTVVKCPVEHKLSVCP